MRIDVVEHQNDSLSEHQQHFSKVYVFKRPPKTSLSKYTSLKTSKSPDVVQEQKFAKDKEPDVLTKAVTYMRDLKDDFWYHAETEKEVMENLSQVCSMRGKCSQRNICSY